MAPTGIWACWSCRAPATRTPTRTFTFRASTSRMGPSPLLLGVPDQWSFLFISLLLWLCKRGSVDFCVLFQDFEIGCRLKGGGYNHTKRRVREKSLYIAQFNHDFHSNGI